MNVYSVRLYYDDSDDPGAEKDVYVVASTMDSAIRLAVAKSGDTIDRLHWKPKTVFMLMEISAIEGR